MIPALLLLSALDASLVASFAAHSAWPVGLLAAGHLVLTALALALGGRRGRRLPLDAGGMAIGSAFGPFGILLLAARPRRFRLFGKRKLTHAKDASRKRALTQTFDHSAVRRTLGGQLLHPSSTQLECLRTTVQFGERAARHRALQTVVRSFEARLSPLIALALQDDDQTVRTLAASASAQISHDVSHAFAELELKAHQHASFAELAPLLLSLSTHGSSNVLLPTTQRRTLCQTCVRLLRAHIDEVQASPSRNELNRALRTAQLALQELDPKPAPVRLHGLEAIG